MNLRIKGFPNYTISEQGVVLNTKTGKRDEYKGYTRA